MISKVENFMRVFFALIFLFKVVSKNWMFILESIMTYRQLKQALL